MVVSKKNLLMASAGVALAFNFSSCKKDKENRTDNLVGEWEVLTEDGDPVDEDYTYTFTFAANQDFSYCSQETGYQEYCFNGDWEWGNDDETEIDIDVVAYGYMQTAIFEIDNLTSDVLEGDLVVDGDRTVFTMKKK